ncbi:protein kinase [Cellulosimicrobium cellulans]|uniref:serine/threonine-protein kinase n=1 Tax=Cellulosimicrobium cellulans TaxID=1710 RepID=UPI001EDC0D2C|nr:serine/threonine-protein kinase [Cellulosimicrobium cellulans]UKJ64163.1 protein kinase [Cellulosimicrobium cellulans]
MPGPEQSALAVATDDDTHTSPPKPAPLPRRPVRQVPASGDRRGPFTLGDVLGHGGFAHVYRATDADGGEVAVKVLTGLQEGSRERFTQEARLLEAVGGRGFPTFVRSGLDDDQPWFAMGLVPGATLRDQVRASGPLDGRQALRLAAQVAEALLVLQEQHCVHRDLKPANIMVDGDRAVLIDLGIAKLFDTATSTQPVGTLAYMAPELFARRVHPRSDVYALGLLLIFATTGVVPADLNFLGRDLEAEDLVREVPDDLVGVPAGMEPTPSPAELPEIDPHLQDLILSMTRYQPNHRPALESVVAVLRARLAGEAADDTLLLTQRIVADGSTAAERTLGPVAGLGAETGAPVRGARSADAVAGGTELGADLGAVAGRDTARAREPWHALVYDATLMSVLSEVHGDGFDGAASEVIADHVASIGAHVADGRTPAELKDWLWQAMQWHAATPPAGHADTLRGWRAYRRPPHVTPGAPQPVVRLAPSRADEAVASPVHGATGGRSWPVPVRRVSTLGRPAATSSAAEPAAERGSVAPARTRVLDSPDLVATQVGRPVPPSVPPRRSPVQHLGPTPRSARRRVTGAAVTSTAAPRPADTSQSAPASPSAPGRAAAPVVAARSRPAASSSGSRSRVGGALLRALPRLLAVLAVLRTLWLVPDGAARQSEPFVPLPSQLLETLRVSVDMAPLVDGPVLALAALAVAVALRVAGQRTWTWLYALLAFASVAATVVLVLRG